jgi:hypothetical protein
MMDMTEQIERYDIFELRIAGPNPIDSSVLGMMLQMLNVFFFLIV